MQFKQRISRVKAVFFGHPKLLIPVIAIASVIAFGVLECSRAWLYLRNVEDYRSSLNMLALKDSVDRLARIVERNPAAYYCSMDEDSLIAESDVSYEEASAQLNSPEKLVAKIRDQIVAVSPPPAYSSLAEFLPRPKAARNTSIALHKAVEELTNLTKDDERSGYCLEVQDALSRVYFMKDLQAPEGVSALLPGQLENFQVNVAQAREVFLSMRFPEQFATEHTEFITILNAFAESLRGNDNNYVEFSRQVQAEKLQLESLLQVLKNKTSKLQERPTQIALYAQLLYGQQ